MKNFLGVKLNRNTELKIHSLIERDFDDLTDDDYNIIISFLDEFFEAKDLKKKAQNEV